MKQKIKIGNRRVGKEESTFIIAEAGSNHNKKLVQAKKLIDVASSSGVDAIKFQLYKAEKLYAKKTPQYEVMKANELPREWIVDLAKYAKCKGVLFLATPFDKEAIDLIDELGIPLYKWASSETTNLPLLRYAAMKRMPLFISTGMCDLADIQEALDIVYSAGNEDVVLLHCTTLYPTKPHQANLRMMDTLRDAFHTPVGFSDHTMSTVIPSVAVARGACVIEKHFTLNRKLKGPDHHYALEPDELKHMVTKIRETEQSLGSPIKMMLEEEKEEARRTSLIAKTNTTKDTRLTKDAIIVKRPAYGIKPKYRDIIIGSKVKKNIKKNKPITWDMIGNYVQ